MNNSHPGKWTLIFFGAIFFASFVASVARAGEPTGGSPNDPLMIPTDWQTLAPNATRWFYFDYAADRTRPRINITLDTNGVGGMQFAIYTPKQAQDWLRDQTTAPVGRGTPYRDTSSGNITRDLYWAGAFNVSGRYFIALVNEWSVAIPFRLTVAGDAVTLYPTATPTASPTPLFTA